MNLNPTDWANAQMLLTKLVQALASFAKPQGSEAGFSFKERLFVPPSQKEERHFSRETRVLGELQAAQKEMDAFIEKIPEQKEGPFRKEADVPKEAKGLKNFPSLTQKEMASPGQAKILMVQVREAIQKLVSSSNLVEPQAKLLRKEIELLKPLLDNFVATLSKETTEDPKKSFFRLALPAPQKKPLPNFIRSSFSKEGISLRKDPLFIREMASRFQIEETKTTQSLSPLINSKTTSVQALPFTAQMPRDDRAKKKKTKKKNFWFRSDRDPEEESTYTSRD